MPPHDTSVASSSGAGEHAAINASASAAAHPRVAHLERPIAHLPRDAPS
jgi:hypothetical protein